MYAWIGLSSTAMKNDSASACQLILLSVNVTGLVRESRGRRRLPAKRTHLLSLETDLLSTGHRPLESNDLHEGAPRNDVEQSLADIWQGFLGVSALTIHDNFFDLGGSSLLATRLCTQIAKVFGKKLPIAAIFEARLSNNLPDFWIRRVVRSSSLLW